jgi:hypothetical protein
MDGDGDALTRHGDDAIEIDRGSDLGVWK